MLLILMFFSIAMVFTPWWIGGGLMFVEIVALMALTVLPKIKEVRTPAHRVACTRPPASQLPCQLASWFGPSRVLRVALFISFSSSFSFCFCFSSHSCSSVLACCCFCVISPRVRS
jgi:hypothetical protein